MAATVVWVVVGTLVVLLAIILVFVYRWQKAQVTEDQFRTFLTLVTTVATVVLAVAIIFQIVNYRNAQREITIKAYSDLSHLFVDDILQLFVQFPKMDYFYNELIGLKKITAKTLRNITLEHKISMLIFARLAKFTIFKQESMDEEHVAKISKWVEHVMNTYLKSNIFKNYWKDYKEKLAGPSTISFMKDKYNL
jgi:hypothetical protein